MNSKSKSLAPLTRPSPSDGRSPHRASTPTERGDTELEGSASSIARTNLPREPRHGQRRDPSKPYEAEPVRLRGVADREHPYLPGTAPSKVRHASQADERTAEGDATEGGHDLRLKRPKPGEPQDPGPTSDDSPRPSRFHMPG